MKSIGWTLTVILLAVATGVVMSQKPWRDFSEQKSLTRDAETDRKKAENDRAELVSQEARLQNPAGREHTARMRGYRKPNETPAEDVK